MSDTTLDLDTALDIVAQWGLHLAFEAWAEEAWEYHMPGFSVDDFDAVLERIEEFLPEDVAVEEMLAAYDLLESRAKETGE